MSYDTLGLDTKNEDLLDDIRTGHDRALSAGLARVLQIETGSGEELSVVRVGIIANSGKMNTGDVSDLLMLEDGSVALLRPTDATGASGDAYKRLIRGDGPVTLQLQPGETALDAAVRTLTQGDPDVWVQRKPIDHQTFIADAYKRLHGLMIAAELARRQLALGQAALGRVTDEHTSGAY